MCADLPSRKCAFARCKVAVYQYRFAVNNDVHVCIGYNTDFVLSCTQLLFVGNIHVAAINRLWSFAVS